MVEMDTRGDVGGGSAYNHMDNGGAPEHSRANTNGIMMFTANVTTIEEAEDLSDFATRQSVETVVPARR